MHITNYIGHVALKLGRTFLLVAILVGQLTALYAQNLKDHTFIISDLTNSNAHLNSISREFRKDFVGLAINLEYNEETSDLLLKLGQKTYPFEQFATIILNQIKQRPDQLIPIFINYTGPSGILNGSFSKTGLYNHLSYIPTGERWPPVSNMLEQHKNIIVFTFQKTRAGNNLFHYAWDYIAEFPNSGIEDPIFDGFYPNGDISKELLMVRDLKIPQRVGHRSEFELDINQNQYFINHLLNRWKHTGKRPNFIFTPNNASFLAPLNEWFRTFKHVQGMINVNDLPFEKVFWKHSNRSITNGVFSFPYLEGEELNLTPYSPGYRFDPQSYTINNENEISDITFEAVPLSLEEGLTAYFPFEGNWLNFIGQEADITQTNGSFSTDIQRGQVAKLPKQSFIKIGIPEKYGMKSSSFTVSAWIKLNENTSSSDYSILGTPEGVFRKGLHLVIRQGRPYFGFYGNDLWATKKIDPQEWYHIVFRYNYFNGEQAIYVNGVNVGFSFNHPSFIGDSTLIIGNSMVGDNFLDGYVDDLYIWDRTLGKNEIRYLSNSAFIPVIKEEEAQAKNIYVYGAIAIVLALAIYLIIKKQKHTQPQFLKTPSTFPKTSQNTLFLFGDFQLIDSDGNELSDLFTPKIKELFLLIVIHSIKYGKGVKTEKLTSELWPGFEPQKAANNRSVTFNKLRKIIDSVEGLHINYSGGFWKAEFNPPLVCDYAEVHTILNKKGKLGLQDMHLFFQYVKRGVFISETHWEWLDELRGFITNEIIDNLFHFVSLVDPKKEGILAKELAERILAIDNLNEKGQQLLLKHLIAQNNLNQAKFRYNQFISNYKDIFGEDYSLSFEVFLEKEF